MPYPETCPECSGRFRNTGTHFTTRRGEVGRHVLLELSCQSTGRRFWWDFTAGQITCDGKTAVRLARELVGAAAASHNGKLNGHVASLQSPVAGLQSDEPFHPKPEDSPPPRAEAVVPSGASPLPVPPREPEETATPTPEPTPDAAPSDLRAAFTRQLQLDRLTLRQVRSWLPGDEARRSADVAAAATEAAYERLALSLFGVGLAELLGDHAVPAPAGLTAEQRLEIQREKARIRARQRRAALKAARLAGRED